MPDTLSISVTVIATAPCSPTELRADGLVLPDGTLAITLPFVPSDGPIPSPDATDRASIQLGHVTFPGGSVGPIPAAGKLRWFRRAFLAKWGPSYGEPEEQEVAFDFFTEALGYGDIDRAQLLALEVGQQWLLDLGDHAVVRLPDVPAAPGAKDPAQTLEAFRATRQRVTKDREWCEANASGQDRQDVFEYAGGCYILAHDGGTYSLVIGTSEWDSPSLPELEEILYREWYLREIAPASGG